MMKLSCKDLKADSTCDFEATGETAAEVAGKMMAHVKADHAEAAKGMNMDDTQMMAMLESKVHM
jgi:predicted small metal-binding protein